MMYHNDEDKDDDDDALEISLAMHSNRIEGFFQTPDTWCPSLFSRLPKVCLYVSNLMLLVLMPQRLPNYYSLRTRNVRVRAG